MKYKIFILLIFSQSFNFVFCQQNTQYTQYVLNNFLLNPAVGGTENYWNLKAGYRNQWIGFTGAPRTMFVSINGPVYSKSKSKTRFKKPHHGVGGYVFKETIGTFRWIGGYFSYSYHLMITKEITASLGIFTGVKQFLIGEFEFIQSKSDALNASGSRKYIPDGNAGVWVHSDYFFAGAAVNQIFQTKLGSPNPIVIGNIGKFNHYFLTGGYKFEMDLEFDFVPSVMIKSVNLSSFQFDVNFKLKYKDIIWGGLSYRHQDAVAALIGFTVREKLDFGYSYDFTISKLRNPSAGSHEVIVGLRILYHKEKNSCPYPWW